MRLAWSLDHKIPDTIERQLVQMAEEHQLDSLWTMENHHLRDGVTTATATLERTSNIPVVVGTLSPFFRHPIELALTTATLERMYPGRVALNLGVGMTETFSRIGVPFDRPVGAMREAVDIIRAFFTGENFAYEGKTFHIEKHKLSGESVEMVPLVFSVMGPRLTELAGEVSDGVNLPLASSPEFTALSRERFEAGSRKADRDPKTQTVVQEVLVQVGDGSNDWPGVRRLIAFHFASDFFKQVAEPAGLAIPHDEIREAFVARDMDTVDRLVSDEILHTFAALGSPAEVLDRIEEYEKAGADVVILYTAGEPDSRLETMKQLTAAWKERGGSGESGSALFPSSPPARLASS
jgi:5,10-methylenetetrahydromethanopterin reductase